MYWSIILSTILLHSSIVLSQSVTDERAVNFLQEWSRSDLSQRYDEHLLRLRRSIQVPTTTTKPAISSKFRVGRCPFVRFLKSAQNCSEKFYESIKSRSDARYQCGIAYRELRSCMLKTLTNCIEGSYLDQMLFSDKIDKVKENFLIFLGDQSFWCNKGGLGVSSDFLPKGYNCDPVFYHVSEGCTKTYRRIFRSNTSSTRLCKEYEKAKICYVETLFRHCSFDRKTRRAVETMIQISDDLQPFCSRPIKQEESILERIMFRKDCPSYSLADVAFAIDVSNNTDKKQFISMKRIIERIVKRMDYGSRGIQIAVFQYDAEIRNILKFGRPPLKSTVQWRVRRMKRTTLKSNDGSKRMTGRALTAMGRSTFSPPKTGQLVKKLYKSGQRPHNPAVLFVLTTGTSSDPISPGLELLKERNVHVVFAGPSGVLTAEQQPRKDLGRLFAPSRADMIPRKRGYRNVITDFKLREVNDVVKEFTGEICASDRQQIGIHTEIVEGPTEGSRLFDYDLIHLFELNPIVPLASKPPQIVPTVPHGDVLFGPIYDGGIGGDMFITGQIPTSSPPSSRWPFYMSETDYRQEAAFENSFFMK